MRRRQRSGATSSPRPSTPAERQVRKGERSMRVATEGGAVTGWFVRLKRVLADLRGTQAAASSEMPWGAWDEWLPTSSPVRIERALARAETQFAGTHDEQAEALETLGRVLGVQASRPSGGSAADAVWNWTAGRHVERRLWEVTIVGCLLTHLTEMEPDAGIAARDLYASYTSRQYMRSWCGWRTASAAKPSDGARAAKHRGIRAHLSSCVRPGWPCGS
jgi:hypothetical protein